VSGPLVALGVVHLGHDAMLAGFMESMN